MHSQEGAAVLARWRATSMLTGWLQRNVFNQSTPPNKCGYTNDIMFAVIQKLAYLSYGSGEFDGQGSGHDFYGTLYHPPTGYVNNCDGGRSHLACDVIPLSNHAI